MTTSLVRLEDEVGLPVTLADGTQFVLPAVTLADNGGVAVSAATAAKQDTGNTSLASIDSKLTTPQVRGNDGILTVLTSITRPADTNAYAVGDAFADSTSAPTVGGFTLTGVARASGKSCILTDLLVINSNPAATPLQGELHIFDAAVTAVNDNAAFGISDAEALTCVAIIPFTMTTGANNNRVHLQNLNIGLLTSGSANLRFLIRVANAYTPASAEVLSVRAKFLPVD